MLYTIISRGVILTNLLACNVKARRLGEVIRDLSGISDSTTEAPPLLARRENDQSSFRFLTSNTTPYLVDHLPDVNFDIGEMYSGNIPIGSEDDTRSLFFVFQPTIGEPVDEITIWLNGGPGCSSLEGFLQENGRFLWQPGTFAPIKNPYAWVNLTNMLWVDQPVTTGFSTGTAVATSQEETAGDFIKFFKNFQMLFNIKRFSIYITGESYAGRYVPYIASAMLDANNTEYYDVKGALIYDGVIGQFDSVQQEVPVVPFVQAHSNLFNFNASFMARLDWLHEECGYKEYIDSYLAFPANNTQPSRPFVVENSNRCNLFSTILNAVFDPNPCFNIYQISDLCPIVWDVLGFPATFEYLPPGATVYFDREDVKHALHAPADITWSECGGDPYVGGTSGPEGLGDVSANPIEHVLPKVIEATNRVLISNGDFDMAILTNGTLLSIQNMTWNGHLGFRSQPRTPIYVNIPDLIYTDGFSGGGMAGLDGAQGYMGIQHFERGLMWAQTFQSGHMQPQFQPRISYRHLSWLLGRIDHI